MGTLLASGTVFPSNKDGVEHETKEKQVKKEGEEGEKQTETSWNYNKKIKLDGRYSLCLDNSYSVMTEKLVTFELEGDHDEHVTAYFSDSIDTLHDQYEQNLTTGSNPHLQQLQVNIYRHCFYLYSHVLTQFNFPVILFLSLFLLHRQVCWIRPIQTSLFQFRETAHAREYLPHRES